jgi:aspartate/methionine/tyrosine aminotransferase
MAGRPVRVDVVPEANPLVRDTGSPPIPEAKAWLARYDGRHGPAIDLSQAVPGDPPVPALLDALRRAAASPEAARYGPILGDVALRETYAAHVSAVYGAPVASGCIAMTAGCNLAFVAVAMALAKAGDAVLLPAPWYFNHEMTLRMLGVEARPLPCRIEAGYVPDAADAERLIDERVRAIVLVSPNNPTGAIYPPATIAAFADLCARRGLWLILDETYRDFLPTGAAPHGLFATPHRAALISLYSFSKAYGMPGHRLGAVTAPERLMPELGKVLDCVQICAPRVPQLAAAWAIPAMAMERAANRDEIARRGAAFRDAFRHLNAWRIGSIGAYFAYVEHPFAGVPAPVVAERLAVERGMLALPGGYFGPGQDGALRFAVANVGAAAIAALPERLEDFAV